MFKTMGYSPGVLLEIGRFSTLKSAMFKTMGYSPGLLLEIGRFSTLTNSP